MGQAGHTGQTFEVLGISRAKGVQPAEYAIPDPARVGTRPTPQALPSWGFRALLWPFYAAGGITGLFVWRWLTSLVTFAVSWVTARRMGAKGLSPLVVMAVAALTYRHRSQVRPETLVGVLLAVQIWILETRRRGGPDRAWWLLVLACVWANVHLSYVLGLLVLAWALSRLAARDD